MTTPTIIPGPFDNLEFSREIGEAIAAQLSLRWPDARSVCDVGGRSRRVLDSLGDRSVTNSVIFEDLGSIDTSRQYDLVTALGAGDHVPESSAADLVAKIAKLGNHIVFSAASPGLLVGGAQNEQWPSYWVEMFAQHGFVADDAMRKQLWDDKTVPVWLRQNLITFSRDEPSQRQPGSFNVVHPDVLSVCNNRIEGLNADNQRLLNNWLDKTKPFPPQEVHWCRIVMNQEVKKLMERLDRANLSALEISGNGWQSFGFKEYAIAAYPAFDITKQVAVKSGGELFDVVICEQVLEHVTTPWTAVKNMWSSLKEGGYLLVTTPFFIRVHPAPKDFSRWTEDGLRGLFEYAGFQSQNIETGSWGNRLCVTANFTGMVYRAEVYDPYAHSLANEPDVPIMVWAFARK